MVASAVDDDYYSDDGFEGYIESTVDPGPWILVFTSIYSLLTLFVVPVLVAKMARRKRAKLWAAGQEVDIESSEESGSSKEEETVYEMGGQVSAQMVHTQGAAATARSSAPSSSLKRRRRTSLQWAEHAVARSDVSFSSQSLGSNLSSILSKNIRPRHKRNKKLAARSGAICRTMYGEADEISSASASVQKSEHIEEVEMTIRHDTRYRSGSRRSHSISSSYKGDTPQQMHINEISPDDAVDAHDPGQDYLNWLEGHAVEYSICCGPNVIFSPATILSGMNNIVNIAEYDMEMRRLIRLTIPFTLSGVIETIFDNIELILISRFISTDAVVAYAISGLFIELSDTFVGGIGEALDTVCSHAMGGGNDYLAGQYVQISLIFYTILSIPAYGIWWFYMGDTIRLLGLGEKIADMGLQFTRIELFSVFLVGISEHFFFVLDLTEHESFGAVVDIIENVVNTAVVAWTVIEYDSVDLNDVAIIHIIVAALFFVYTTIHVMYMGWFSRKFTNGILKSFALGNTSAVKTLAETSIPVMFGELLAYGEWEILTIFAAHLGPAEAAAWAMLSSIWDMFESSTEGIGEAAAIRIAHHLGKGNPVMAKISAYKSSLLATIFGVLVTSIFFIVGDSITVWFTRDATLQNLISQTIPLIGIGNMTMTFGMLAWNQLGGQGRYAIATIFHLACSWFITLPLAALSAYVFNFNLEGIVASIVIGFSTLGMILSAILLSSDWERLSIIIQELVALEDDSSSSSSSSSDDDSSSSSSSSDESLAQTTSPTISISGSNRPDVLGSPCSF